ncbi:MAG TPA: FkbM family methyltransferase [Polyangia bacterium]
MSHFRNSTTHLKRKVAAAVRRAIVRSGLDERLANFTHRAPPNSLLAKLVPDHTFYNPPHYRKIVRNGLQFELDISDYMQWCAYFGIATEPREALYGLANAGMCVIDVGTNVGETVLNFSKRVGAAGVVHGFEVVPSTYERCRRNLDLNGISNVVLNNVGLAHQKGRFPIEKPSVRNSGGDRLGTVEMGGELTGETVEVTTLDDYVAAKHISRIDLIKVDVEGFETNVLRGAMVTLSKFRPALFVEVSDGSLRRQGSSGSELIAFLTAQGYECRHAETGATVDAAYGFAGQHFDVIARSRSH